MASGLLLYRDIWQCSGGVRAAPRLTLPEVASGCVGCRRPAPSTCTVRQCPEACRNDDQPENYKWNISRPKGLVADPSATGGWLSAVWYGSL